MNAWKRMSARESSNASNRKSLAPKLPARCLISLLSDQALREAQMLFNQKPV
jgi:hypothetical protein